MTIHSLTKGFGLLVAVSAAAFAQTATFTVVNAASWGPIVAPDSIAAGFGTNLVTQQVTATSLPLQSTLGGLRVDINDSNKVNASGLFYMASAAQTNFLIPATVALGRATVAASNSNGTQQGFALISNVAPGIFAANGNGTGAAAAQVIQVSSAGNSTLTNSFAGTSGNFTTSSISLSPTSSSSYLVLYGTGIRRHSLNPVQATVSGVKVPVLYAGAVGASPGLDQVNIGPLPQSLAGTGKGDVDVVITVDGVPSNAVKIAIQ